MVRPPVAAIVQFPPRIQLQSPSQSWSQAPLPWTAGPMPDTLGQDKDHSVTINMRTRTLSKHLHVHVLVPMWSLLCYDNQASLRCNFLWRLSECYLNRLWGQADKRVLKRTFDSTWYTVALYIDYLSNNRLFFTSAPELHVHVYLSNNRLQTTFLHKCTRATCTCISEQQSTFNFTGAPELSLCNNQRFFTSAPELHVHVHVYLSNNRLLHGCTKHLSSNLSNN